MTQWDPPVPRVWKVPHCKCHSAGCELVPSPSAGDDDTESDPSGTRPVDPTPHAARGVGPRCSAPTEAPTGPLRTVFQTRRLTNKKVQEGLARARWSVSRAVSSRPDHCRVPLPWCLTHLDRCRQPRPPCAGRWWPGRPAPRPRPRPLCSAPSCWSRPPRSSPLTGQCQPPPLALCLTGRGDDHFLPQACGSTEGGHSHRCPPPLKEPSPQGPVWGRATSPAVSLGRAQATPLSLSDCPLGLLPRRAGLAGPHRGRHLHTMGFVSRPGDFRWGSRVVRGEGRGPALGRGAPARPGRPGGGALGCGHVQPALQRDLGSFRQGSGGGGTESLSGPLDTHSIWDRPGWTGISVPCPHPGGSSQPGPGAGKGRR